MYPRDLTIIKEDGNKHILPITDFLTKMNNYPNILKAFVFSFLIDKKYYFDNKNICFAEIFNPQILNDTEKQIMKERIKYGS